MLTPRSLTPLLLALLLPATALLSYAHATPRATQNPRVGPQVAKARRTFDVNGVKRNALVVRPGAKSDRPVPLVFVFHGHGGNAVQTGRKFAIHKIWPEALVVYPQGLKTVGALTDPKGKRTGWQTHMNEGKNRDLDFFDHMLKTLGEEHSIDNRRIHVTGHSNGGGFSYFLWSQRGKEIASLAPSASASRWVLRNTELIPRPVLHIGSPKDTLVLWKWQEATINALRKLHECGEGEPWGERKGCTRYPGKTPVYTFVHKGGHRFSDDAPAHMVAFFKSHPLPEVTERESDKPSEDEDN